MKTAIDLFCGCGGMSEGLLKAGFDILFANDISEYASLTYKNRHKQLGLIDGEDYVFYQGDIKNVTGNFIKKQITSLKKYRRKKGLKIDAVFGGPPCQGFSMAGKRKKDDPRNYLFKEYLRVVSEIMPDYVVMENVVGFLSTKLEDFVANDGQKYNMDNSLAPNILVNEFKKIGYKTLKPKVLNSADYGIPQNRKRIIFFAYKNGVKKPVYPKPTKNRVTLKEAIGDFYINGYKSEYIRNRQRNRCQHINNMERSSVNSLTRERFSIYKNGETTSMLKKRIIDNGIDISGKESLIEHLSKTFNMKKKQIISLYKTPNLDNKYISALLTKKNMRKKLDPGLPSLTVVTIPDDYINPFNNSIFTVRELARIQSFDDDFIFYGKRTTGGKLRKKETPQYTQVGNAVPPLLSNKIGKCILNAIECNEERNG